MMKKLVLAMLAAFTAVILAACSGGGAAGGDQNVDGEQGGAGPAPTTQAKEDVTVENLESVVTKDVEGIVSSLSAEYEALAADIDSYEKYVENADRIEAFYAKAIGDTESLGLRLRQYSVDCASTILSGDETNGQKYDDMETVYDIVYEDAGDDVYDEVYDGIFKNMYDLFYDGILKDAYDSVGYGEWSEVHSAEYDMWSDTRSDIYDVWSDLRSDVYDFYSDVCGELYSDDSERAQKKIDDFQEDIDKLRE